MFGSALMRVALLERGGAVKRRAPHGGPKSVPTISDGTTRVTGRRRRLGTRHGRRAHGVGGEPDHQHRPAAARRRVGPATGAVLADAIDQRKRPSGLAAKQVVVPIWHMTT
jgi:hypothetical protein